MFTTCLFFLFSVKRSKQLPSNSAPWPPFRFPGSCDNYVDPRQLLDCKTFHAFLWTVLYRYVHRNTVSEHVLSLAVYLLEMLLSIAKDRDHITQVCLKNQFKIALDWNINFNVKHVPTGDHLPDRCYPVQFNFVVFIQSAFM